MGTRSRIATETANGSVYSIYCHWDGYPKGVGATLQEHYQDDEKIRALIDLGSLSSLDASIEAPAGHAFESGVDGHTVAYGRDRGETGNEAVVHDTRALFFAHCQDGWEEYAYLRVGTEWWVAPVGGGAGPFLVTAADPDGKLPPRWKLLADVLSGDIELYEDAAS